jgi:DNA topoisomerase-2
MSNGKDSTNALGVISNISYYKSVRLNPDKDIGRNEKNVYELHGFDKGVKGIVLDRYEICDILYNIFDEIVTNAVDLAIETRILGQRNISLVTRIAIWYDDKSISVENDGPGFPIKKNVKEEKTGVMYWCPEAAFTLSSTGRHFNKGKKSYSGGKNGHGAKLAMIYSTLFKIDTMSDGRRYRQDIYFDDVKFLPISKKPIIEDINGEFPYSTKITFFPDTKALDGCTIKDIEPLIIRRAYEITQFFNGVVVSLNGKVLPMYSLKKYVQSYLPCKTKNILHHKFGLLAKGIYIWNIALYVGKSNAGRSGIVSYVNGMYTSNGGSHVNYALNYIVNQIYGILGDKYKERAGEKKSSMNVGITKDMIKGMLSGMIVVYVDKPQFESQIKSKVFVPVKRMPKLSNISENALKKFINGDLIKAIELKMESLMKYRLNKEIKEMKSKGGRIKVRKYRPSEYSQSKRSPGTRLKGILIISEGDSANGQVIKGLKVLGSEGSKIFGTFPVRGKVINAMKQTEAKVYKNEIFKNIVTVLGLEFGKDYTDSKLGLNYGKLLIFTDADEDGTHIKGLIISIFKKEWPSLLKRDDFMYALKTPYVRIKKGDKTIKEFYSLKQYESQKIEKYRGAKTWFYKGIGSNNDNEISVIFNKLYSNFVTFKWDSESNDWMTIAFGKDSEIRKLWLKCYDPTADDGASYEKDEITYSEFIDSHMKNFALYDNWRKIPSITDGLKPVQRMIIFGMKKLNSKHKTKVNILSSKLMALTHYAHGEQSFQKAMTRMAQRIAGVNNLNFLKPEGNFGSREELKCSQPRYIYTLLERWTKLIFRDEDDPILILKVKEGVVAEPVNFAPIVPVVLINGAEGIGTAHSTSIPKFNIRELITLIVDKLDGNNVSKDLIPWYIYYKGKIEKSDSGYVSYGIAEPTGEHGKYRISEIPIGGKSYQKYKEFLNGLVDNGILKSFLEVPEGGDLKDRYGKKGKNRKKNRKSNKISPYMDNFIVKFSKEVLNEFGSELNVDTVMDILKLRARISTNNMKLFNVKNEITRYKSAMDIFEEYYNYRLGMYEKRKSYLLKVLKEEINVLKYMCMFIEYVIIKNLIKVKNVKRHKLIGDIDSKMEGVRSILKVGEYTLADGGELRLNANAYAVLRNMKIDSMTVEAYEDLKKKRKAKMDEIDRLKKKSVADMWRDDLADLLDVLPEDILG